MPQALGPVHGLWWEGGYKKFFDSKNWFGMPYSYQYLDKWLESPQGDGWFKYIRQHKFPKQVASITF